MLTMSPSLVPQVIGRKPTGRGLPSESKAVIARDVANPFRRQMASGTTFTEKTSLRTATLTVATWSPVAAVTVALPPSTPVTMPRGETLAIVVSLDFQLTDRPVRRLPALSL